MFNNKKIIKKYIEILNNNGNILNYLINNIKYSINYKKINIGLSGDNVYICKYNNKKVILKIYNNKKNYINEIKMYKYVKKILPNHIPLYYYYGDILDNKKIISNKVKANYIISEFVENISLQESIISKCQQNKLNNKIYKKLNSSKKQWRLVFIQIYYIISKMCMNLINHCDIHGENILITINNKPKYINFNHLSIKDKYTINKNDLLVKIIDLDTLTEFKIGKTITFCNSLKAFSGKMKYTVQGNILRHKCGVKLKKILLQKNPLSKILIGIINPYNGDLFNFYYFLESIYKYNIFNKINILNIYNNIFLLSSLNLNKIYTKNKTKKNIRKYMIKYIKNILNNIYNNLIYGNNINIKYL